MQRRDFLKLAGAVPLAGLARENSSRPNLIIILADDVGYSDFGCYGGEIHTPHVDRLAQEGIRFTEFYNCARCCPSRAALMTGLYSHQAGIGGMTGRPVDDLEGYQGHLNNRNVTIAEVMRAAGYSALMVGKWHLNNPPPVGRGFEEYYGLLGGFDSYWDPTKYRRLPEGRPERTYAPGQFYSTNVFTDYALDFLSAARRRHQPYFLYFAFNAAHFPLHAPKTVIDKYAPVYARGWDVIRQERFVRMRSMGLLDKGWDFTPRSIIPQSPYSDAHGWTNKRNPAWDTLPADRCADLARRMATYAAAVEVMDHNIGRLVEDLRANGELENTVILLLSDNGACAEWDPWGFDGGSGAKNILHTGADLEQMGQPGSYISYGSGWANACNTPFRLYKHYDHEGGISTPFIAHWPAGIARRGGYEHQMGHIIDLMPTCAELAGARYPTEFQGRSILPMEGRSLLPAFAGKQIHRDALFWEHEGSRAVRMGKWKAVALLATGQWELYDMDRDRTEMHNLASRYPERLKELVQAWNQWAERTHAVPWPWKPPYSAL